jgi:YbbR domain-containing protein
VAGVRASADIDRLTSTYNSPRTLEAFSEDGRVVDGVTIDPPLVNVQVPINSSVGVKRVPIVPLVTGAPASGYSVAEVTVSPQLVTLTGSSGPLDNVQSISTAAINLAGATGIISRTVSLQEPDRTRLGSGEPTSAVVTIRIVPLDRQFQISLPLPVQVVNVENGLQVTLSPAVATFTLQGRPGTLGRLDTGALIASVNARGLGPGVYSLAPTLALPTGVQLAGPPENVTVTLRFPATAIPAFTALPSDSTPTVVLTPEVTATVGPSPTAGPALPTATALPTAVPTATLTPTTP